MCNGSFFLISVDRGSHQSTLETRLSQLVVPLVEVLLRKDLLRTLPGSLSAGLIDLLGPLPCGCDQTHFAVQHAQQAAHTGGTAALAGAVIILTGIVGSLLGETVCKVCRITDPLAKGLALGTSAHAIGTSKALQMGEIEGAMSGLAIAVAGIMTAILAPVAANFLP